MDTSLKRLCGPLGRQYGKIISHTDETHTGVKEYQYFWEIDQVYSPLGFNSANDLEEALNAVEILEENGKKYVIDPAVFRITLKCGEEWTHELVDSVSKNARPKFMYNPPSFSDAENISLSVAATQLGLNHKEFYEWIRKNFLVKQTGRKRPRRKARDMTQIVPVEKRVNSELAWIFEASRITPEGMEFIKHQLRDNDEVGSAPQYKLAPDELTSPPNPV